MQQNSKKIKHQLGKNRTNHIVNEKRNRGGGDGIRPGAAEPTCFKTSARKYLKMEII